MFQLNKELEEQNAKIGRVGKQNAKYSRELRSAKKSKGEAPEEVWKIGENNLLKYLKDHLNINRSSLQNLPLQKDFEVRELREFNKNVTKQIGESVQQNPDIAQAVHLYFSQADLPPPPTQGILESFNQLLPSLFSTKRKHIHLFSV